MAVNKATRSQSSAQPQRRRAHHQLKAEIFDTLQQLNRGYGIALSALQRLPHKDRLPGPAIFPAVHLRDLEKRTEALRALANRDLLRLFAGREDRDAARLSRFCGKPARR